MGDRWRTDPDMDFFGAGVSKHLVDLSAGGCPDNGVIHCDNPFAFQQFSYRIQFDLDAEVPDSTVQVR